MGYKNIVVTDAIYEYMKKSSPQESELLIELRQETSKLEEAGMQIDPLQGQLMAIQAQLIGTKKAIEVGVFTGYSSLCVAKVLPENGKLIACDVSEDWTSIAKKYWEKAGVANKIDLRIAPALETLNGLVKEGQAGTFDFAFIDADKINYDAYYETCLTLLRQGGLVIMDNVLWGGDVIDTDNQEESTVAIRAFNEKRSTDNRVDSIMIGVGDGLTLLRKR